MRVELRLARAENEFLAESVTFADPDHRWERSFAAVKENCLMTVRNARGARSRAQERQCPRCNRWILYTALSQGLLRTSFITLWNGEPGDGPGGTQNMVELVRASSPVGSRSSSTPRLCNCARATNHCAAHLRRHGSARRAFELEKAGSLTQYRPPTSWKERGVSEMAAAMQLAETPYDAPGRRSG
jgi:hypothetical protein